MGKFNPETKWSLCWTVGPDPGSQRTWGEGRGDTAGHANLVILHCKMFPWMVMKCREGASPWQGHKVRVNAPQNRTGAN